MNTKTIGVVVFGLGIFCMHILMTTNFFVDRVRDRARDHVVRYHALNFNMGKSCLGFGTTYRCRIDGSGWINLRAKDQGGGWMSFPSWVWIYFGTFGTIGAILYTLVAILHGSEVWVAYWMLSTGVDASNFDNYWGYGIVMVVMALVIVLYNGTANLSRKHERIRYQEQS